MHPTNLSGMKEPADEMIQRKARRIAMRLVNNIIIETKKPLPLSDEFIESLITTHLLYDLEDIYRQGKSS